MSTENGKRVEAIFNNFCFAIFGAILGLLLLFNKDILDDDC